MVVNGVDDVLLVLVTEHSGMGGEAVVGGAVATFAVVVLVAGRVSICVGKLGRQSSSGGGTRFSSAGSASCHAEFF